MSEDETQPEFRVNLRDTHRCFHSCDIDIFLQLKICQVLIPGIISSRELSEPWFYLECMVTSDNNVISLTVKTRQKPKLSLLCEWREWLVFPIRISDLPKNAKINFKLFLLNTHESDSLVGEGSFSIFNEDGEMLNGDHDIELFTKDNRFLLSNLSSAENSLIHDEIKLLMKDSERCTPFYRWLDALSYRVIENLINSNEFTSSYMSLSIRFQDFITHAPSYSIVYFDPDAEIELSKKDNHILSIPYDPGLNGRNIFEEFNQSLTRSIRIGRESHAQPPNPDARNHLKKIIESTSNIPLTIKDKDLIWRFRRYLTGQKEALAKFLLCVDWTRNDESKEALDLMNSWAKLSSTQALELFDIKYQDERIRFYAVSCLFSANDEELNLHLLELVFCLNYDIKNFLSPYLKTLLIPDSKNIVEPITVDNESSAKDLSESFPSNTTKILDEILVIYYKETTDPDIFSKNSSLLFFLLKRCSESDVLSNFFYWYLNLVGFDNANKDEGQIGYKCILKLFSLILLRGDAALKRRRYNIGLQISFLKEISEITNNIIKQNLSRKLRSKQFQAILTAKSKLIDVDVPSPLNPCIMLGACKPESSSIFNSVSMPFKFTFLSSSTPSYTFIYKLGDDLRQDQIIISIINLMNKILLQDNIDLHLTPYQVIAITSKTGLIEFIPSNSVAKILSLHGTIQNYFRHVAPSSTSRYGIDPDILDRYIKSCAGYSVITYLLGIGDRHLDNLLITESGKLFHIDFSYILGQDPKPYPPPIKLCKEMVEGMGGLNSEEYSNFLSLCYTSFIHLRRHANVIVNVFSLLVYSEIGEFAIEPEKAVSTFYEKFRLDLHDEQALSYLQGIINDSVNAVFATVVETFHKIAQKIRG